MTQLIHMVCRLCGLLWKEEMTPERERDGVALGIDAPHVGRMWQTQCPRCNNTDTHETNKR